MAGDSSNQRKRYEQEGEVMISVIIPAYNSAATIVAALESALVQDIDMEIIVVDDCSKDNLDEVMAGYVNNPVIRYVKNEKNSGAAESRNRGVAMAKGRYIAFLDADDWWAKGKLKKQIACIERSKTALCATARELMTPNGKLTGRVIPVREEITYQRLLGGNEINCSSVVVKTEVMRAFPMEHPDSHEDYITWLRILKKYGKASAVNEPLLKYRLSNSGKSGNKLQSAGMTFKVYRYVGFGVLKSCWCFARYAVNGVLKYAGARR